MADQFIGARVVLALAHPPGARARGLVVNAVPGQLTLNNVIWLHTGAHQSSLNVQASNILDLDIEQDLPGPTPVLAPAAVPHIEPAVDPAILSYARPPVSVQASAGSHLSAQPASLRDASQPPHSLLLKNGQNMVQGNSIPSATLTEPFDESSLNGNINESGTLQKAKSARRGTRGRKKNAVGKETGSAEVLEPTTILVNGQVDASQSTPKTAMGPGWRETPLTQSRDNPPMPQLHVPTDKNNKGNKRGRRQRQSELDDQNGWATGEATDIQEMGDFDFEENHKKFDKKKVFEQIRQEDTTADEERLVSFNRLPARPGTYGGKNLHFTEMVMDSPTRPIAEHSSDSDSGRGDTKIGSSRMTRRTSSRTSARKVPSRKGSAYVVPDGQMTGSGTLPDIREDKARRTSYDPPLSSNPSIRSRKSSSQRQKPALRTTASDHLCPCVTPLQMNELEQLAISELGLTEDMMTENAAIAIAQTARKIAVVNDAQPSRRKSGRKSHPPQPLIVVLAGNHKTGSRAIAAARQLRNHDTQVLLCVLGLEREADLLENVRRQLGIFRKCGGRVVEQSQLMETLKRIHASTGKQLGWHLTTDLIVDALLGMHLSFEDLRMEDQAAYSQLVQWANLCDVTTISIDVPSGVDASSGEPPNKSHIARLKAEASRTGVILQGDPGLVIDAHHVLSLGAPKNGLLLGKDFVNSFQNHSSWLVADIGLDDTVWKKSGLRGGQGIEFGSEWVTKMEIIPEARS